jgi:hypothetical protein
MALILVRKQRREVGRPNAIAILLAGESALDAAENTSYHRVALPATYTTTPAEAANLTLIKQEQDTP